jgi:hypothetical protein
MKAKLSISILKIKMPDPTPRNPRGAGRKPTPEPNKVMQSFWCDPAIAQELKNWKQMGFKSKASMINFALKGFLDTYRNPNKD